MLEYVVPEVNIQCLRLATSSPKVPEQLLKLDQQGVSIVLKALQSVLHIEMVNKLLDLNTINHIGAYDFRDAENVDGIPESSHKNGIYCIKWNVTEFAKFWMDISKVGKLHLNQARYGLVSVNI